MTDVIEYEVYGYNKEDRQTLEVCYTFAEAKKTAHRMHKEGLIDVRMTKSSEWDLLNAWQFVDNKLTKVE